MKKTGGLKFLTGFALGAVIFGGTAALAVSVLAQPKTAGVVIDGRAIDLKGYVIEDTHYFQLRDLDAALKAGGKDFSIVWDGANNQIIIDTSRGYDPNETLPNNVPVTPTTPQTSADIPGGTAVDYSLDANPAIFGSYYTREKYNTDRQRVLDTGEIATGWGSYEPSNEAAISAADKFIASLSGLSELEKVNRISNFLCANMTYKAGVKFSGNDFWTGMAYGVCEQYSQMFRYMCYRAGIPCVFVTGKVNGNGHGWNEVYIDGKWQFYDGTYSDSRNTIALGDTAESATTGRTYTEDSPKTTIFTKELFVPSSTK